MQKKMRLFQLPPEEIEAVLTEAEAGRLATIGQDGYPYVVPLNFVFFNGHVYTHGLNAGEKIANITRNEKAGFEVDVMHAVRHGALPCDTGVNYASVVIKGTASLVTDKAEKVAALRALTGKYAPQHTGADFPEEMTAQTAVIKIIIVEKTGKRRN